MNVQGSARRIGDPCPICGKPLERIKAQFLWQGKDHDGAYCKPCNTVRPIKGEEIEPLKEARRGRD